MPAAASGPSFLRRTLKPVWYSLFRYHPQHYLGALLWAGKSEKARADFLRRFLVPGAVTQRFRDLCLQRYLTDSYFARYSDSALTPEPNRRLFWGGRAGTECHVEMLAYYTAHPEEFERENGDLLAWLGDRLESESYEQVIEIGCGNGLLLERLAAAAPTSETVFVGLDLDPETIALNRHRWPHSRVRYEACATLEDYLSREQPGSALVVANGTFQFYTEPELAACLRGLATLVQRGALVLSEVTALDLEREQRSRPATFLDFSHNYAFLLDQAGLQNIECRVEARLNSPTRRVLAAADWGADRDAARLTTAARHGQAGNTRG